MIKKLLFFALAASPLAAMSQGGSDPFVPGSNPFRNDQNFRAALKLPDDISVDGSPYLVDEYLPMEVTLTKGGVYQGIRVKINVVNNEVLMVADNGFEMATTTPIKSLKFIRSKEDGSGVEEVVVESFNAPINSKGAAIYEVLVNGKARLLKQVIITYSDGRKYPEGTMLRTFKRKTIYYYSVNNQEPLKLEKGKDDVLAIFPDKQAELKSFMEKAKLKCRTEQEIVEVFRYYARL